MRTYPDDPDVHELPGELIRTLNPEVTHSCQGCPHWYTRVEDECPYDNADLMGPEYICGKDKFWYGQHIYVANKLEGGLP